MNKKVILTILMSLMLWGYAPRANAVIEFPSVNNQQEVVQNEKNEPSLSILPKKQEGKIVLGKFFITMLWVVGSSAVLFLLLLLYKKHKGGVNSVERRAISKEQDLNSPVTVDEAVKLFIEKF